MTTTPLLIKADLLEELLTKAKETILKKGDKKPSQRGFTWSLNTVLLSWTNPSKDKTRYAFWPEKEDEWYHAHFVAKKKANVPEKLAKKGDYLFPYTYAQRSRFFDTGLGYGLVVLSASDRVKIPFVRALKNKSSFLAWLTDMGEFVHLQTVLAPLTQWGKNGFKFYSKNKEMLVYLLSHSRID